MLSDYKNRKTKTLQHISVGFHIGFFEIDIEIPKKRKERKHVSFL